MPLDRDFRPSANWERLRLRAHLLRRFRTWFEDQGYLEVETPILSADTVVDRHLDPFTTVLAFDPAKPQEGRTLYLQTSPELAMKRLLAAGGSALYQITRSFRNGESGPLHNPEFTIVEWYRVGDGPADQIAALGDLAHFVLQGTRLESELAWPAETLTYSAAFERALGLDPHTATLDDLRHAAGRLNLRLSESCRQFDSDGWLDLLLTECVQPRLGVSRPVILCDFPASQAALAQLRTDPDRPPVAERFELYISGVELANGYHELLDPAALRLRTSQQNAARQSDGKPPLPCDNLLLSAMDHGLPPCSGVALGFDRLVMLASDSTHLSDVLAFPVDRA